MTPIRPGFLRLLSILVLAAALAPAGASARKADAAFQVPREEILARIKTIGVMPLDVPDDIPDAAGVAARYETEVVKRLERAGFKVVGPEVMRAIRERLRRSLGGLYNPQDGKPLEDKVKAYQDYARNEFDSQHPVDGVLRIGIIPRRAPTYSNQAQWDGVSEGIGNTGFAALLAGGSLSGTTPALSFLARLYDNGGTLLYAKAGGLQILQYLRQGWTGVQQTDVDRKSLMTDPARDARAWAIALDALLGENTAPQGVKIARAPAAATSAGAAPQSREEFIARYRNLLLVPLDPGSTPTREEVQRSIGELLRTRLAALGFQVQVDADYAGHWAAEQAASGGFYDAFSGELDTARVQAARARVLAQSQARYPGAFALYPGIVATQAPFQQGEASWDGARQQAFEAHSKLGNVFNTAKTLVGHLDAYSLRLRICDADGNTVYEQSGGLQLAERLVDGKLLAYPDAELFTDTARNAAAVDRALLPLAAPAPPPAKDAGH
jgi:hypothetical protein